MYFVILNKILKKNCQSCYLMYQLGQINNTVIHSPSSFKRREISNNLTQHGN